MRTLAGVALAVLVCAVPSPFAAAGDAVLIFAAASLRDALHDVTGAWTARGGAATRAVLASSSTLARQIEQGAPADVYLSANVAWMDYLAERRLLDDASRIDLLGNSLVLVAPRGARADVRIAPGFDLAGALAGGRLAVGDPAHVPAGIYARQALEHLGAWRAVEPLLTRSDNVRAALALVARGEAPLGIVYASDALAERGVRVVGTFPAESHDPIVYPAALIARSRNPDARALLDYLASPEAAARFERFGLRRLR